MINIIFSALILLILYWKARNLYYDRLELSYKHKLYALRDKLRMYAIQGEIDKNSWIFEYLDTSICRTISALDKLDIYLIMASFLERKKEEEKKKEAFTKLTLESATNNKFIKEIVVNYGKITLGYLISKHFLLFKLPVLLSSFQKLKKQKAKVAKNVNALLFEPETSSINDFISRDEIISRLSHQ